MTSRGLVDSTQMNKKFMRMDRRDLVGGRRKQVTGGTERESFEACKLWNDLNLVYSDCFFFFVSFLRGLDFVWSAKLKGMRAGGVQAEALLR